MVNRSWYTNRLTDAWKTNRRQIWLKVLLLCICYVGEKIRTRKSTIQMDVGTFSKICKWVSFVFRWWWLEMLGWKSSTRIHLGDKSWNTNSLWGNMWISTWLWNIWFLRILWNNDNHLKSFLHNTNGWRQYAELFITLCWYDKSQ